MNDLHPGWTKTTLGNLLLSIEAGTSFRCEARPARPTEWGIVKVSAMTWGEFRETENKAVRADITIDPAHEIKPGDILLSRANTEAYVGASVIVANCRPRLLLSDKSLRLVPSPAVEPRWLAYALSSPKIRKEISYRATGTKESMRNISQTSLRDIRMTLPPLAEQHRIVTYLEEHLSQFNTTSQRIYSTESRLDALNKSILREFRERASLHGAKMLPLGDIAETGLGKMLDSKRAEGIPTPYLRNINVRWGSFDLSTINMVPMPEHQRVKYALQPGDLLVCEGGEPGRCAIWTGSEELMAFQKALHRIRPRTEITSSKWVAAMLEEAVRNKRVDSLFTGTTIKHLPQEKLRRIQVPIPPLEVQQILLAELKEISESIGRFDSVISNIRNRGSALRGSLLDEALTGRLTPQDLVDEPASTLLERVQSGNTKATQSKVALF